MAREYEGLSSSDVTRGDWATNSPKEICLLNRKPFLSADRKFLCERTEAQCCGEARKDKPCRLSVQPFPAVRTPLEDIR